MTGKKALITLVGFITLSVCTVWAGPHMNPGKWEITAETQMAGMPPQKVTHIQCVTEKDMVPASKGANQECQVTDIVRNGNTVSWKITCGGQSGGMEGTGSVTYTGDSMNGTMDMVITGAGNMKVKNIMSGRRIGECDGTTTGSTTPSSSSGSTSKVGNTIANDAKDVGRAARDEAKQSTINEVKKGVKSLFKGLFN